MESLEIIENGQSRVVEWTKPALTIGREGCDVLINDQRASRKHCVVERTEGGVTLRDLNSRNGTWMGDNRVLEAELEDGDVFRIGATEIRVRIDSNVVDVPAAGRRATRAAAVNIESIADGSGALPAEVSALVSTAVGQPAERGMPTSAKQIRLLDRRAQPFQMQSADGRGAGEATNALTGMLFTAFRVRATDIHLDAGERGFQVRFRVDGQMQPIGELTKGVGAAVLNVIKVLCEIDIAKKSVVQEGNFTAEVAGRRVDFRVSMTPSLHGQKLALRILDKTTVPARFEDLGIDPNMTTELRRICSQDAGMIIVSGPTGSGKTTTLYTVLRTIDSKSRNVVTIEDPVEYQVASATQISIDAGHGITFASVLATVLRQDPDVILVGEIRDRETADMAMQAATTGHLVLTTIHARDSIGTIFRLLDLGVEPYLIANAVTMAVAQRLVRVLCPHCKAAYRPDARRIRDLKLDERSVTELYTNVGCTRCMRTGFFGRAALFETLIFNPAIRDVIMTRPTIGEIRKAAGDWMFRTLVDSGYRKVFDGLTTVEEVERVATAVD